LEIYSNQRADLANEACRQDCPSKYEALILRFRHTTFEIFAEILEQYGKCPPLKKIIALTLPAGTKYLTTSQIKQVV